MRGLLLALAAVAFALRVDADWVRDFKTEGLFNDNVTRANRDADVRDDFAFGASARVGRFEQSGAWRLTLTGDFDSQLWSRFDDFDHVSAGATAAVRYKFGLGTKAPFVRIEGSARFADFRQDEQDGWRTRTAIVAGKRLTERLGVELGYRFDEVRANHRLFDQEGHSFSLRAAFDLTASTQLTAGYTLRRGDVISYARPPRPDLLALAHTSREVATFGEPFIAYNLDATSHTFSIGVSQAITQHFGVSVRYERQETSRSHISYLNNVVVAGLHISL